MSTSLRSRTPFAKAVAAAAAAAAAAATTTRKIHDSHCGCCVQMTRVAALLVHTQTASLWPGHGGRDMEKLLARPCLALAFTCA